MEVTGLLKDCYIPDKNNENNILLDTCVYDKRLCGNDTDIDKLKSAMDYGFQYFKTDVQEREISGVPDRKRTYDKPWETNPNAPAIMKIMKYLDVKKVSCYAHPMYLYFVILDGTFRVMEDENSTDPRVKMFYEIYNHNKNHLRDAIIAEASIYNNCKLVSTDGRLIRKVNKFFEGSAIHYDDFIKTI